LKTWTASEWIEKLLREAIETDGEDWGALMGDAVTAVGFTFQIKRRRDVKPGDLLVSADNMQGLLAIEYMRDLIRARGEEPEHYSPDPGVIHALSCEIFMDGSPEPGKMDNAVAIIIGWPKPATIPTAITDAFEEDYK
jgi:hypothetical protein